MAKKNTFYATGKRKSAVAKTWIGSGVGKITVNKKDIKEYFPTITMQKIITTPLSITENINKVDVNVSTFGGGIIGQANAVSLGIAKALIEFDENLRSPLKKAGLIKRDDRVKERKKYGQRKARAKFQFSKR